MWLLVVGVVNSTVGCDGDSTAMLLGTSKVLITEKYGLESIYRMFYNNFNMK